MFGWFDYSFRFYTQIQCLLELCYLYIPGRCYIQNTVEGVIFLLEFKAIQTEEHEEIVNMVKGIQNGLIGLSHDQELQLFL